MSTHELHVVRPDPGVAAGPPRPSPQRIGPAIGLSVARWAAITTVLVNLGIHLALAPMHLAEMPYIGVLFVIGSALLGAVMIGLSSDHDRLRTLAWTGGALVCACEFTLFVISRTSGLPLDYHEGWAGQTEDQLGLISLVAELVFLGCAAASLTRTAPPGQPDWMPVHDRTAPLR